VLSGRIHGPGRHLRPHHHLDRRGAQGFVLHGNAPKHGLEQVDRGRGIPLVESELGQDHRCEWVTRRLLEELLRLAESSLPAAQVREPHDREASPRGSLESEALRLGERLLGLGPAALPREHCPVVRAAGDRHEIGVHAPAELRDLAAPLGGTLEVTHPLAGVEQEAKRPARRNDLFELAGERSGGGLVQAAHAVRDGAFVHERQSLDRHSEHLERHHAETSPQLACADRKLSRRSRVPVGDGHVPEQRIEPAVLGAVVEPLEDAGRSLEPAVGDRALTAEDQVVVSNPEREQCRAPPVSLTVAQAEGALARVDARRDVLDPPGGPAEPFQRIDRLVHLELLLEDCPCLCPRATGERSVARQDTLLQGNALRDARTVTPAGRFSVKYDYNTYSGVETLTGNVAF
jgi:hypothetical protein